MRLSKFLSLSVAMSRNQAKFFIRKGRVSVNRRSIIDPDFELADADTSHVVFDGKPISIAAYQYFLLNKPATYVCAARHSQHISALCLLKNRPENHYYYFANDLAPELSGLVLISDDARWTSRMKRKLSKKPCIYHARSREKFSEDQFQQLKNAWLTSSKSQAGPIIDIQKQDERTLILSTNQPQAQEIVEIFSSLGMPIEILHLQQLGRMNLGNLAEGDYLNISLNDIKI